MVTNVIGPALFQYQNDVQQTLFDDIEPMLVQFYYAGCDCTETGRKVNKDIFNDNAGITRRLYCIVNVLNKHNAVFT